MFEKYPYEFYQTPEGKSIYHKWCNNAKDRCKEWDDFSTFCEWCLNHKNFTLTAHLRKHVNDRPHSPENSYFKEPVTRGEHTESELIQRWNDTVNKIRKHYGLEPLIRKCTCCGEVIPKYSDECPNCLVSVKNNESEKQDG